MQDSATIRCKTCAREYVLDRAKGHRGSYCNSCSTVRNRKSREERITQYMGSSCVICGYNKTKRALVCHHLDASQKEFQISGNWGLSWDKIKVELDKCILVCANCHAEIHDGITAPPEK